MEKCSISFLKSFSFTCCSVERIMLTSKEAHTRGKTDSYLLTCDKAWKLSQHIFSCTPSIKLKGTVNSGPSLWLMAPLIRESWGLTFKIHACGCSQTIVSISFSEKKPLEIVPFNNNRSHWNLVCLFFLCSIIPPLFSLSSDWADDAMLILLLEICTREQGD